MAIRTVLIDKNTKTAEYGVGEIRERLAITARGLERRPRLLRLMVPPDVGPVIEKHEVPSRSHRPYRVCVARDRVDSTSPFLYHKTTHRALCEHALASSPEYDNVLLINERDEVTESCRAKIVAEKSGRLLTPPIRSGVLPGTFRALLFEQGMIEEEILHLEDLQLCSRIFLINSVRGRWNYAFKHTSQ